MAVAAPAIIRRSRRAAIRDWPARLHCAPRAAPTSPSSSKRSIESSGKRLWIHETAPEGELPPVHDKHNLASASPVTDGERVYAWFGTGQIVALDVNGKPVWSKHLGKEYGSFDIQWGHASSPVLFEDSIILLCYHSPASYIVALDKRTGAVKWKVDKPAGQESYSSPIVVQGPGGNELIVNSDTGVESFDPATGKSLWTYPEVNRFPIPVSMVDNGILYLSRGYRSSPFMAIRLGGRGDITKTHVAWRVPTGGPYVSSLVHYQGVIYMSTDNGILSAFDASNGERLWQERVGGTFSASPIAGDGKVYFVSEGGETIVIKAGRTLRDRVAQQARRALRRIAGRGSPAECSCVQTIGSSRSGNRPKVLHVGSASQVLHVRFST